MAGRDDFNPNVYTVEQQQETGNAHAATEMIRAALKSDSPSIIGYLTNPETGEPLYPNLYKRNEALRKASDMAKDRG